MSLARREEILNRVFEILETIPGLVTKARNRGLMDNDMRPCGLLLDADEQTIVTGAGRGRQKMQPVIVKMMPQIFIVLKGKKPANEGVGAELNDYRAKIITALNDDAQLLALIGPNGDISYDGCLTDLKNGSTWDGQMQLDFSITTIMDPNRN
jgi:hypothetical protein